MKYITSVKDGDDVKHIVEVSDKNIEVIQCHKPESYGNRKGERAFLANGVYVAKDFTFRKYDSSYDFVHLAQAILAIELVRFVISHLEGKHNV